MPFIYFFFVFSGDYRDLHSFPTRRSSDLGGGDADDAADRGRRDCAAVRHAPQRARHGSLPARCAGAVFEAAYDRRVGEGRSEEHTFELQSHSDLVCRLLLEKKKQTKKK